VNHVVESDEPCHAARCIEYRLKAVVDDIPRLGCGIDVIASESQQVDEKEGDGEMYEVA
jgi:hypothetical protein